MITRVTSTKTVGKTTNVKDSSCDVFAIYNTSVKHLRGNYLIMPTLWMCLGPFCEVFIRLQLFVETLQPLRLNLYESLRRMHHSIEVCTQVLLAILDMTLQIL